MKYQYFGNTGIQISKLGFGTMTFGGEADEKTAAELYYRCREVGINLFDCANIYHEGQAEEILGKFIKAERQNIVLCTKAYFPTSKDINAKGLSRRHIYHALHQSLKRLDTDYVDVYFMHRFDENTPLEESLGALTDLIAQGKILYIGVSNFAAWQIMKSLGISELKRLAKIAVIQPMYNLIKRQVEVEILPMAQSENLAVISYNPLAGGLLTGKYSESTKDFLGRLKVNKMYQLRYGDEKANDIAFQFKEFALSEGYSPAALAIAWVAHHGSITAPLLGARNINQLNECLQALEIKMTDELYQAISTLSPQPSVATDRNEESKITHA